MKLKILLREDITWEMLSDMGFYQFCFFKSNGNMENRGKVFSNKRAGSVTSGPEFRVPRSIEGCEINPGKIS